MISDGNFGAEPTAAPTVEVVLEDKKKTKQCEITYLKMLLKYLIPAQEPVLKIKSHRETCNLKYQFLSAIN